MRGAGVLAAVLVLGACADGGDQPAVSADQAQADSVVFAAEQFDASVFDTITWDADTAAVARGRVVWAFSCRKCHGTTGMGDAGFVLRGDTLRPPSFIEPDWSLAGDPAAIHLQIFTGNTEGMPHWGLVPLPYRDIDAVTQFILEDMRAGPESGS